jgi:hypothetical protein
MLIFDLQEWPWPLRKVAGCCAWHIVSLLWTIVASIYKIPSKIRKWTGHDIYPQIDNVDLEWASATLTLEVGVWLLGMTHRLITTNICAKLFQIPLINDKVMDQTRKCDRRMDRRTEPISISPFFLRKGGGQLHWHCAYNTSTCIYIRSYSYFSECIREVIKCQKDVASCEARKIVKDIKLYMYTRWMFNYICLHKTLWLWNNCELCKLL